MRFGPIGRLAAACALAAASSSFANAAEVGDRQTCVSLRQIDDSRIIDDKTIVLRLQAPTPFRRVDLAYACTGLTFSGNFTSATSIGQLCENDIIRVTREPVGSQCTIEQIVVIDEAEAKALLASRKR